MPRFAAIDVGSNASRLLIVSAKDPERLRTFRSVRVPVRLGHSVFQTGRLDPSTVDRSVEVMRKFALAMDEARVEDYRAVVTASARSAENGAMLLERVREETGLRLDAVDGSEEARLVSLAVDHAIELPGHAMLMDLGGGSLELSDLGSSEGSRRDDAGFLVSLAIGTVRLLEAFLEPGEPVTPRQDHLLREYLDRLLAPHRRDLRDRGFTELVGTGGNLVAIAAIAGVEGAEVPTIDVERARALRDVLATVRSHERAEKHGLKPDRADVIVPALYAVVAVAELMKLDRIVCPGVGLKEGIIRELVDKHYRVWDYGRERDQLFAAALELGRRYHFDERHGTKVAGLALDLFDGTRELHGLGTQDRGILRLAGLLHDIGDFVHPQSHHKHTQYIIEFSDLMGLPPEDRRIVSLVARYHRRAAPALRHAPYAALQSADRDRVKALAAILRVADALDRGHRGKVDGLSVDVKAREVLLEIDASEDVSLETWTVDRKAELFRDVFGCEVRTKVREAAAAE